MDEPFNPNDEVLEVLGAAALHVARATARHPSCVRGMMYYARVGQHLGALNEEELRRAHHYCGYLRDAGWNTLDKALTLISGEDPTLEDLDTTAPITLYAPAANTSGWVRIFRLKSARLSETTEIVDSLVSQWLNIARLNEDQAAEVKGIFGLPIVSSVEPDSLREAILASDLFSAPWMVAMWRPDTKWVVWGVASRFLQGEAELMDLAVQDFLARPRADQSFSIDEFGLVLPGCGPSVGIGQVISAVDYAFQTGSHLELLLEPLDGPIETWSDGVPDFTEMPLMGVVVQTLATSWLVRYVLDVECFWRIAGLDEGDHEPFKLATGVNPKERLGSTDFEALAKRGIRIESWIPTASELVRKHQER